MSAGLRHVAYVDLPPGTPTSYQGALQNIATQNGGTVTKERDWKIEGATGSWVRPVAIV